METAPACGQELTRISGEFFLLTGTLFQGEEPRKRDLWWEQIRRRDGIIRTKPSKKVTILVAGLQNEYRVKHPLNLLSEKAWEIFDYRLGGHHVHVIDNDGLSDLLNYQSAPCLALYRTLEDRAVHF